MPREAPYRLAIANANVPDMLGSISHALGRRKINIHNMLNKSKGEMAYTLVDADSPVPAEALKELAGLTGVLAVRYLPVEWTELRSKSCAGDRRARRRARRARPAPRRARAEDRRAQRRRARLPAGARERDPAGAVSKCAARSPASASPRCSARSSRRAAASRRRSACPTSDPKGTFSEQAVRKHFGRAVDALPAASVDEAFRRCESGAAQFTVVPVENSTEGAVGRTLDLLVATPLRICGEIELRVHQNLMSRARDFRREEDLFPCAVARAVQRLAEPEPARRRARAGDLERRSGAARGGRGGRGGDRRRGRGRALPARRAGARDRGRSEQHHALPRARQPRARPDRHGTAPRSSCRPRTSPARCTRCSRRSRSTASA